jgi:hypothetical protein
MRPLWKAALLKWRVLLYALPMAKRINTRPHTSRSKKTAKRRAIKHARLTAQKAKSKKK